MEKDLNLIEDKPISNHATTHDSAYAPPTGESIADITFGPLTEFPSHIKEELLGVCRETDPHGTKPGEAGAKLDAGKNRMGLVLGDFARALEEVSKVGTFGANKYSAHGWISVPDGIARYTDAMKRHDSAVSKGIVIDDESGCLHAAQRAWNALAALDLMIREAEPKPINVETSKDVLRNYLCTR